jgi:hypothetical protein
MVSIVYGFADPASGRGHQHVHRVERLHARHDHGVVGRLVGGVRPHRQRLAPACLHEPGGLGGRGQVEVGDAHLRPLLREAQRARPPDATAAAGDQRDLAREPFRHRRLLLG